MSADALVLSHVRLDSDSLCLLYVYSSAPTLQNTNTKKTPEVIQLCIYNLIIVKISLPHYFPMLQVSGSLSSTMLFNNCGFYWGPNFIQLSLIFVLEAYWKRWTKPTNTAIPKTSLREEVTHGNMTITLYSVRQSQVKRKVGLSLRRLCV